MKMKKKKETEIVAATEPKEEKVKTTITREIEIPKGKFCEGCKSLGINREHAYNPSYCSEFKECRKAEKAAYHE